MQKYRHSIVPRSGEGEFPSTYRNLFPYKELCTPRAIFGYVRKNASVQEDINPSINIIYLTPLVNKNLTFDRTIFLKNDLEKSY